MAIAVLHSRSADAQEAVPKVGDRVRITAPVVGFQRVKADLTAIEPGAFSLRVVGQPQSQSVRLVDIHSMDVRTGTRTQARKGAGRGLLAGVVVGGIIGLVAGDEPPDAFFQVSAVEKAMLFGTLLGAAGSVGGAIWGARTPTDRWTPATLDR